MLVGLTGFAGSGKDTAAQALLDNGFDSRAFAGPLRTGLLGVDPLVMVTEAQFGQLILEQPNHYTPAISNIPHRLSDLVRDWGWDLLKRVVPEVRRLQQAYGTEGGRDVHGQQCWIKAAELTLVPSKDYVFTDVRFPNERDFIHQQGGLVIRICRDGVGAANAHASEQVLDNIDVGVMNNGTIEELHAEVLRVVRQWYPTWQRPLSDLERRLREANQTALQRPIWFGGVQLPHIEAQHRVEGEDIEQREAEQAKLEGAWDDHEEHIRLATQMTKWETLREVARAMSRALEAIEGTPPYPIDDPATWDRARKFYEDRLGGNGGVGGGSAEYRNIR